ncbi:ankyrin repeat protein [Ectocarpus siliculosus]|uniref:Ankyrin repeat protein n=1 Tax=Ectocarpus siliculosus TaxID=2880 RepID=D8LKW6_ECTSI|nr:ankyrin repeat protein [Ectocarpus siliculosus]|eukprot:CBN80099.1 ankyrin repeat protein [Ectocarpus siliculosus]
MAAEEDRTALNGLEKMLFKLVSEKAASAQWSEWLRAPLEHAVAEGDNDLALALLKAGADGSAGWEGCGDRTLLQAAAEGGNEEVVLTLLDNGGVEELDVVSGDNERTALHRALAGGHTEAARVLMLAGADVGLLDVKGRSALHYAIEGRHLQLAGDALLGGADPKAMDADGNTPLHFAAAHDDDKFVGTLLRRGAHVNAANNKGKCPLHVAAKKRRVTVAEALLKAGADPNARYGRLRDRSPLFFAHENVAMTRTLLEYGADVLSFNHLGFTALHTAATEVFWHFSPILVKYAWANAKVIGALLEAGADLEARSGEVFRDSHRFTGLTPLHVAAYHQKASMAELLRKGADVNAESDNGLTPLHMLCMKPRLNPDDTADLLLRWGADETAIDNEGYTPKARIVGSSNGSQALRHMLDKAPVDRAWRRRGTLIMCRALPGIVSTTSRRGRGRRARARTRAGGGRGGDSVSRRRGLGGLLARVVELDDAVFRTVVGFL